jgi:hypothetical protein
MEVVTGLSSGDQVQIISGLQEGQTVVSSATFLIDAESNLGAAMAGMAGMDHSGMDMGGEETMDMGQDEEMDHSQHQMEEMAADTTDADMDHSQHQMGGTPPDTMALPDTTTGRPRPHRAPFRSEVGS